MPDTERLELTLGSLADLDNFKIQAAFQKELKRCVADVLNRPNNKKKRTITLTLSIVPGRVDQELHDCESIMLAADIKSNVPLLQSQAYEMAVTKGANIICPASRDE